MTDKFIAIVCLAVFFAYLIVAVVFIKEFDLGVIIAIALAMVTFDFWRTLYGANGNNKGGS